MEQTSWRMIAIEMALISGQAKRRCLQFSLRGLMLCVAGLCVWIAFIFHRAREQQRAVNAIEADYGRVMYDYQQTTRDKFEVGADSKLPTWLIDGIGVHVWHAVVFVDLDSELATDETLSALVGCRELEVLHISNTSITKEGLRKLEKLPRLRILTINTAGIDDDVMRHIADIPALEELQITDAAVTDEGLVHLSKARTLRHVWLDASQVTDAGADRLRTCLPKCRIEH